MNGLNIRDVIVIAYYGKSIQSLLKFDCDLTAHNMPIFKIVIVIVGEKTLSNSALLPLQKAEF